MERALIEYLANALWQLPLLAGAAWLLLRIARPGPLAQHWVWVAVLATAVVLPLPGLGGSNVSVVRVRPHALLGDGAVAMVKGPENAAPTNSPQSPGRDWTGLLASIRNIPLAERTMDWLAWMYLAAIFFGGLRLLRSWMAARRLVKHSREMAFRGRAWDSLQQYGQWLGVEPPPLRGSSEVLSPAVVGAWKPVLLLPENFLEHTEEEIQAALCHELAHVRRRDALANLLCQAMALPLVWHPATYAVQRRIRSTREMVCDAMAAEEMRSEIRYARCLVSLAENMLGGNLSGQTHIPGLFDDNTLEERVMRLTHNKTVMSARGKIARAAGGAAVMMAAVTMAAMLHVTPILAQAQDTTPKPSVSHKPAAPKGEFGIPGLTAIGHGKGASIRAKKGEYIHRWTGADGKPFIISNHQRREPTPEERRRIERAFARRMAKMKIEMKGFNMPDIERQIKDATAQVDSPAFKKQFAEMQKQNGEFQRAQMAAMNADLKALNMSDIQRQVKIATAGVDSPAFKKQMAEMQKQNGEFQRAQMAAMNADLKALNMSDIQRQVKIATAELDSRELEQEMAGVQEAVRNGGLKREKAIQILKDAQTQLEKTQTK